VDKVKRANEVERRICQKENLTYINDMADAVDSQGRLYEIKSCLVHRNGRAGRVKFKPGQLEYLRQHGATVIVVVCTDEGPESYFSIAAQEITSNDFSWKTALAIHRLQVASP